MGKLSVGSQDKHENWFDRHNSQETEDKVS